MSSLKEFYESEEHERICNNIIYLSGGVDSPFMRAFNDKRTIEILLNPDGKLWQQRLGEDYTVIDTMTKHVGFSIIADVATSLGEVITAKNPILDGEFPLDGSRFCGQIPPFVSAPAFTIRKKAIAIFTLQDYVDDGIMTDTQRDCIISIVKKRKNVVVVGGTKTGKTTLTNAIINEITTQHPRDRIILAEDTVEIQCSASNYLPFRTTDEISMTRAVKTSLRVSPTRIIIGEVRDHAALDVVDAWNTGHQGGICTIHANDAESGLTRFVSLVSRNEFAPRDIEQNIADVVNYIICIVFTEEKGREIKEILEVTGYDKKNGRFLFKSIA